MRKLWFGLIGAGAVVGVACSSAPSGNGSGCGGNQAGTVLVITASDNHTFSPQMAQVSVGQSICFQNVGTLLHTVTPDSVNLGDSAWAASGERALPPGLPVELGLAAGDYYYHCRYHGGKETGMWGKISVR